MCKPVAYYDNSSLVLIFPCKCSIKSFKGIWTPEKKEQASQTNFEEWTLEFADQ
jgi:hypothetical protein